MGQTCLSGAEERGEAGGVCWRCRKACSCSEGWAQVIWGELGVIGYLSASDHGHLLLGEAGSEEAKSRNSGKQRKHFTTAPDLCSTVLVSISAPDCVWA